MSDILTRRRLLHQVGATALMTGACNLRIEAADYCLDEDGNGVLYTDDGPFPTTGECQVTASQIEGPFFVDGAPQTADLVQGEDGTVVTLSGKVGSGGDVRIRAGAASCQGLWNPANPLGVRRSEAGMLSERALIFLCSVPRPLEPNRE